VLPVQIQPGGKGDTRMRMIGARPVTVRNTALLPDQPVPKAGGGIDTAQPRQADTFCPLGITGAIQQDQVRLLVALDGFRVRHPEGRVFVCGTGENYLCMFPGNALGKVLQRVVDRVNGQWLFSVDLQW